MTVVPFAPWRPDVAHLNGSFASDVMNVLCASGSYIPCPQLVQFSTAVPSQPISGFSARNSAGQVVIFVGTATKLYVLNTTTLGWDDVTKTAGTYGATVDEKWRFTQFGDFVIAVNVNDPPQVYQIGVSTRFADLAGSPPRARHIAVWGDFLALGGLNGNENRVHWSALNDITGWTPGTNNSDYQDFPDGGDVQGMTEATNPIVFLKSAIQFGTFVPGSVEVFTFHKVHDKRGSAAPYAIASRGSYVFFADSGGFFQIGTDGTIVPIGFEKVDRTVFGIINGADLAGIIGAVDPFFTRVYWAVKYGSTSAAFDRMIVYDWNIGEWTQITNATNILFPLASGTVGYSLEGLDAVSASLDALPFSLDSKVWQGGAPVMAALDADFKLSFFSGEPAEATLTTQEMGDTAGAIMRVTDMMPIIDTNATLVSVGARMRRGDVFIWSDEGAQSTNTGLVHKKCRARFHQFKARIPESTVWTHAQGLDVRSSPAGLR